MSDSNCWLTKLKECPYSSKLLAKVSLLNKTVANKIDITEIKKAIYYARKYHGSQMRQSGEPYYSHPIEVAFMVASYLPKTDFLVTSILHDTIEDTELTFELINESFGSRVAHQVLALTRSRQSDGRRISAAETVEYLIESQQYELLLIKQFDRLHNMQTLGAKPADKIRSIVKETIEGFLVAAIFLEIPELQKDLIRLCYQNLSIEPLGHGSYLNNFQDNFQPLSPAFQNDLFQMQPRC